MAIALVAGSYHVVIFDPEICMNDYGSLCYLAMPKTIFETDFEGGAQPLAGVARAVVRCVLRQRHEGMPRFGRNSF